MTPVLTSETISPYRMPGGDGVVAMSELGAILFVSDELDAVLGPEHGSMIGRSFLEFVYGDDVEQLVDSFTGIGRHAGRHEALEIRITNGDDVIDVGVVVDNRIDDPDVAAVLLHVARADSDAE